jgi:hypothetical protein
MDRFFKKAEELGHDVKKLKNGETIEKTIKVHNIEELKALFHDDAPGSVRSSRLRNDTDASLTLTQIT